MKKASAGLKVLIALVLIVVIVGVALIVVFNLTLAQLGMSNTKVTEEYSVSDLQLDQIKLGQAYTFLRALATEQDATKIATKGYTEADGASADEKFSKTGIGLLNDTPNYENLLYSSAGSLQAITLKQTELAYTLDSALHQFYTSTKGTVAAEYSTTVQILKTLDASVVELSFYKQNDSIYLKTVIRLNISEYTTELNGQLPFKLQDLVYCTLINKVEVKNNTLLGIIPIRGRLSQTQFVSVSVNNQNTEISELALNALFKVLSEDDTVLTCSIINTGVCALISDVCSNIGGIGVKNSTTDYQYGEGGIDFENEQITFLPKIL